MDGDGTHSIQNHLLQSPWRRVRPPKNRNPQTANQQIMGAEEKMEVDENRYGLMVSDDVDLL